MDQMATNKEKIKEELKHLTYYTSYFGNPSYCPICGQCTLKYFYIFAVCQNEQCCARFKGTKFTRNRLEGDIVKIKRIK